MFIVLITLHLMQLGNSYSHKISFLPHWRNDGRFLSNYSKTQTKINHELTSPLSRPTSTFADNNPSFSDHVSELIRLAGRKMSDPLWPKELPESFDARKHVKWRKCRHLIGEVRDEGAFSVGTANAVASALSGRYCIHTRGKHRLPLSSNHIIACCPVRTCGKYSREKDGASVYYTLKFVENVGIPTGGGYNENMGCQPYSLIPCQHEGTTGPRPRCSEVLPERPRCEYLCTNPHYESSFPKDITNINDSYLLSDKEEDIRREIYTYGPVIATFVLYEDFISYKEGVYNYTKGKMLKWHKVKLIGWGVDKKTPYWLAVNSWNTDWGDKGMFKIRRGYDECGIELMVLAGGFREKFTPE